MGGSAGTNLNLEKVVPPAEKKAHLQRILGRRHTEWLQPGAKAGTQRERMRRTDIVGCAALVFACITVADAVGGAASEHSAVHSEEHAAKPLGKPSASSGSSRPKALGLRSLPLLSATT